AYVVNADGSLIVGNFSQARGIVGWHPERGAGLVRWVVASGAQVFYNTAYAAATLMEAEDAGQKIDCALAVNDPPANMLQAGKGPFWWVPGGTVTLAANGVDLGH